MISNFFNSATSPSIEIEQKYLLESEQDLNRLIRYCIAKFKLDRNYYDRLNGTRYYNDSKIIGVLDSKPITWYYDTPDHKLEKSSANLRLRISETDRTFYELAIKGFSQKVNGILIRHEEEFEIDTPVVSFQHFKTDKSKAFIHTLTSQGITEDALIPIFATDVHRLVFMIHHRGVPVEIAFDEIAYRDGDKNILERQYEVELEYKGDGSHSPQSVKQVFALIERQLKDSGVMLNSTERSKGSRGYAMLANKSLDI